MCCSCPFQWPTAAEILMLCTRVIEVNFRVTHRWKAARSGLLVGIASRTASRHLCLGQPALRGQPALQGLDRHRPGCKICDAHISSCSRLMPCSVIAHRPRRRRCSGWPPRCAESAAAAADFAHRRRHHRRCLCVGWCRRSLRPRRMRRTSRQLRRPCSARSRAWVRPTLWRAWNRCPPLRTHRQQASPYHTRSLLLHHHLNHPCATLQDESAGREPCAFRKS
mmetsp:Transcript_22243/g.71962  ORF Transcript_22243/g.71962 Transcript_22243/m.71962 type:complete len:223 (-) Transcript_22243:202-870(-)